MYLTLRNKILLLILLILLGFTFGGFPVKNSEETKAVPDEIVAKQFDPRAQILADYFASYNSPLQYQAQDFIDASDTYNVDWKLVPAIAGVESTFGKHIPNGTYNGWGWGVYGNQALGFKSWRDGIFTVTEGLRKNYIDKGLTTPYTMNRVYAVSPAWGWKVSFFMNDLEKFAKDYPEQIKIDNPQTIKSARESAKLAYK